MSILLSPSEFTSAAARALGSYPGVDVLGTDELAVRLQVRGVPITGDLGNFYLLYRNAPEQLGAIQQALVAAVLDLPDRSEADGIQLLEHIYPMLRNRGVLDEITAQQLPALVSRPLAGELVVCYVIDEGQRVVFVNEQHAERWDVSEPLLNEIALRNLRARDWQPRPGRLGSGASGLLIFNGGDGYDATRLLLPELFEEIAAQQPGNLVIGVPNRDFLIAFSDAAPSVFQQVAAQIAVDAKTRDHPLTEQLFTLRDGNIEVYQASGGER